MERWQGQTIVFNTSNLHITPLFQEFTVSKKEKNVCLLRRPQPQHKIDVTQRCTPLEYHLMKGCKPVPCRVYHSGHTRLRLWNFINVAKVQVQPQRLIYEGYIQPCPRLYPFSLLTRALSVSVIQSYFFDCPLIIAFVRVFPDQQAFKDQREKEEKWYEQRNHRTLPSALMLFEITPLSIDNEEGVTCLKLAVKSGRREYQRNDIVN